jgi:hypothetical protein
MMFLDCPAYLDPGGAARCGLPAVGRASDESKNAGKRNMRIPRMSASSRIAV